ncbi:hypothetical protein [Haloarcula sp. H-GB5]|jgi:hypothetical protein
MSSNEDPNNGSNDNDSINVLVLATGLVKAERYVKDYAAVAEQAVKGITGIEAMLSSDVDKILTRGSRELQTELDTVVDTEVDSAYFGWIGFLNDEAETDDSGNEVVPAVRQEGEIEVDTDLDDVSELPWSKISNARIQRAKAKAGAKMNHFLFDDYYDQFPSVDAVVTLNCGSHRGMNEIQDSRGSNTWVVGQAGHVKQLVDINVQDEILYSRHLLDGDDDMTADDLQDSQVQELRSHLSASELEDYGIETAATASTGGVPASAD